MTTPTISRERIIETLTVALQDCPSILAAWLGGSDGSGRTDQWSDVDLQLIVEDGRIDEAYRVLHTCLQTLSPIEYRYRLPRPTWHGHDQEFFRLRDAAPWHFMDVLVMERGAEDHFLDLERHGEPLILFDRGGLTAPTHLDRKAHQAKMAKRLAEIRQTFPMFQHFVTKAMWRGQAADAMAGYFSVTIRPLVELLRMRYAPDLYDYGMRYLDRDLPPDRLAAIEELVLVPELSRIEEFRARAEAIYDEEIAALDAGVWGIGGESSPIPE